MHRPFLALILSLLAATAANAQTRLWAADRSAAFKAAGFSLKGREWHSDCDDPGTPSYSAGAIETVRDLNGDGRPEAIITEGGAYCYGNTGAGYVIVSKQETGGWRRITGGTGAPNVLTTRGPGGWPDIEVGGPGFCFPVERWNGREYVVQRHSYEGRPCKPPR